MKKTYLINKEYLHKLIDELPDTAIVSEDGFMYQVTDGESSEIGKMGSAAAEVLVQVSTGGQIEVWEVPREPSAEMQRIRDLEFPAVRIAPPSLETLFAGFEPKLWLEREAQQLARAESPLLQVAGVGLVARLWSPKVAARSNVAAVLAGDSPRQRALQWFGALELEQRAELEQSAVAWADALQNELAPLQDAVTDDPDQAAVNALSWLHQRDDLQSLLDLVQSCAGPSQEEVGESLARALDHLDQEAAARHSIWSLIPGLDEDERLLEVAWQEPERWWGALTVS